LTVFQVTDSHTLLLADTTKERAKMVLPAPPHHVYSQQPWNEELQRLTDFYF